MLKVKRRKTLTSEVITSLREAIVNGSMEVGTKLPTEQALATQMDVSRTVVREAVAALKADGLVKTKQGVGAFVANPGEAEHFKVDMEKLSSIENVLDLLELRVALESEMAGLAAQRRNNEQVQEIERCLEAIGDLSKEGQDSVEADFQFHLAIAKATQNQYFVDFVRFMGTKTVPSRDLVTTSEDEPNYVELINKEHSAIANAIADQDVEAAKKAARQHMMNSCERHSKTAGLVR